MGGQPELICMGKKLKRIMNTSEKVFYGRIRSSVCRWIEHQPELIGWHIHHALCCHGRESCVVINKNKLLVDGFHSETSTVYQFYRCKWDGCLCLGITNNRKEHMQVSSNDNYRKPNPRPRIQCGFGLGMLSPRVVN